VRQSIGKNKVVTDIVYNIIVNENVSVKSEEKIACECIKNFTARICVDNNIFFVIVEINAFNRTFCIMSIFFFVLAIS